jgi:hypothetical protein
LITLWSAGVLASEVWTGIATIPHPVGGKDFSMHITLTVDEDPSVPSSYSGKVEITGSKLRCGGMTELQYLKITNGNVQIRGKPFDTHGCGYFLFNGSVIEGAWVGKFPWNGRQNDLTLKK